MSRLRARLARHAQTLVGSLGHLARHPVGSAMTMAVIGAALALPLLFQVALLNANAVAAQWNRAFDLSVYLGKQAGAGHAQRLAQRIGARPDVATVRVITAAEALAEFRRTSGFGKALDALTDNPLPDTLVVTPSLAASTPEGTASLQAALAALPEVDSVQLDTAWVQRLIGILHVLERVALLTGVLLSAAVVLVVGNTIRLDVLNRRAEIEVMKLVGATDGFARRPFVYGGIWYGLGGGIVALLVVALATFLLAGPVERLAAAYASPFRLHGLGWRLSLATLAAAVSAGGVGAWVAATVHIRAIEP